MGDFSEEDNLFELVTVDDNFNSLPSESICKEFLKEETLLIPDQKPDIEQLAKILIKPKITNKKIIQAPEGPKVIVQGLIIEKKFYVADTPQQSVHAAEFSFPFCNFIKLPPKTKVDDLKIRVEDVILQLVNRRKISQCILTCLCVVPKKRYCQPAY
ncbi:hypothetical protein JCM16358_01780 [Halanaerocella petrolearia]